MGIIKFNMKMKAIITVSLLMMGFIKAWFWADFSHGVDVIPSTVELRFRDWISLNMRSYSSKEEYRFRYKEFARKEKLIQENSKSNDSHRIGHNRFSDWTSEEWEKNLPYIKANEPSEYYEPNNTNIPETLNWV